MTLKRYRIHEAYYTAEKPVYDIASGVLKNPKLWGKESKNGYTFTDKALAKAVTLSEEAVVYVDHELQEGAATRSVRSIFGIIKRPYKDTNGEIRASEFKWDTNHPYARSFAWQLENTPNKIGFSVHADAAGYFDPSINRTKVDDVKVVESYDIVAGPANTGGILESTNNMDMTVEQLFECLAGKIVADTTMDVSAKKKKLSAVMKLIDDGSGNVEVVESATPEDATEDMAIQEAEKYKSPLIRYFVKAISKYKLKEQQLTTEVANLKSEATTSTRIKLAESKLPATLITATVRKALATAKDDTEVNEVITEQIKLYESIRPNPQAVGGKALPQSFAQTPQPAPKPFSVKDAVETLFG